MCTTSFTPPFDERSKISNSLRASNLVANGCGYTQGPFWLPWRIILVGQGSRIEATQNLLDVRSLDIRSPFLPLLPMPPLSPQLPMKFGNIVQVETSRYLTKITTLRKADREGPCSQAQLCTAGGNQVTLDARSEFKIPERSPKGVKLVVP